MGLASRLEYEELAEALGGFDLVQNGLLMLCKTEPVLREEAEVAEKAHALGIPAEVLSAEEVARRDPSIRMDVSGAVYFPQDGHLTPPRLMAALQRHLEASGVEFCWNIEVTGWRAAGERIEAIQTTQGEISADEVVVACGAWSAHVLRGLPLRLPMQSGKGYSVTLPAPRHLPTICSILTEARVAVTPMGGSLRFAGTMEITGLDRTIDRARVNGIFKSIPRYFPEFHVEDFQDLPVWSGLRPCSPDGLPYLGRFRRYANLSVAAGHAMVGVSLAPITGKLMAEILSGEPPSLPIAALNPDRYA